MIRTLTFLCLIVIGSTAMAIEEPKFSLIEKSETFELRQYAPKIVAETTVTGSLDRASNKGFRRLAEYIFGNNTTPQNQKGKIAMTAPVGMKSSDRIDMTAPVNMENKNGSWTVSFVMPAKYTMETLPKPNNAQVTITPHPAQTMAVIRFSGFTGDSKVAKKTEQLLTWMKSKNLTPAGEPQLARYNPPWTLPFMRRNEILIPYKTSETLEIGSANADAEKEILR